MVYRRRFLSNPYDLPASTIPEVVEPEIIAEPEPEIIAESDVLVDEDFPKVPKRVSKAKKSPVAE